MNLPRLMCSVQIHDIRTHGTYMYVWICECTGSVPNCMPHTSYMYTYMHMYMYVLATCIYKLSLSLSHTHTHTHTHTPTHTHTHTHTHTTHSDLTIMLSDRTLCGHKFVLVARSRHWSSKDDTLTSISQLDLSNMTPFMAISLVRWVYTDIIVLPTDQDAVIELLAASNRYQLTQLKEK